jgi:hypothetical protein
MAKITPKRRDSSSSFRRISTIVHVERSGTQFKACAFFGRKKQGARRSDPLLPNTDRGACKYGQNPRAALANALHASADLISKHRGAFAGYSKVNRKTRRTARKSKRS